MFSHRTNWGREPNRLSELLEARRKSGMSIYDLTVSNPTECGIKYPQTEILSALSDHQTLHYQPNPRGILSAREAISQYYREKKILVDPSCIFLTASTSEAYSFVFKLLCNPGDAVLVPRPSYPLFDYLAQVNDVQLQHYSLRYDGEWHIETQSVENAITSSTKGIVLVHPHNPTGMFLKEQEFQTVKGIVQRHDLALVVDEVFADYPFGDDAKRVASTASESEVLTFTLNGISKSCGLPQMKLGWIVVSGEKSLVDEAISRLEILCDTYLSVNLAVQLGLPAFLRIGKDIRDQLIGRIMTNYTHLRRTFDSSSACSVLTCEGGWYGILQAPRTKSDESWAVELLESKGIYLHPGYFFDFEEEGCLVVSLLVEPELFRTSIGDLTEVFSE